MGFALGLLLALVVVGSGAFAFVAAAPGTPASAPVGASAAPLGSGPVPAATHGDLVVVAGETVTIQPTLGGHTYFQGGNITVEAGGTLNVRNVTLSFVQFVSDTGSAQSRLSHIDHFDDAGTVNVVNSTITTDVAVLNAYAKLSITVNGTFTAWDSTLSFPGWVAVGGAGATLTLNGTLVTGNPQVRSLVEPSVILGDTEFAPSLTAVAGGVINLFGSTLNDTYANNLNLNGVPTPAPLGEDNVALPSTAAALTTPNDSANLTRDWLYPAGPATGQVQVWYNDSASSPSTYAVAVTFQSLNYPLGDVTLKNGTSGGFVAVNFTAPLTAAIDAAGLLAFLNDTGAFGGAPSISLTFTTVSGPASAASAVALVLTPALQYNVVVSGAGSTLNAVDSVLNLTWNAAPATPWSTASPYPWLSNHLALSDGAAANLANISVPTQIPGVFSTSAIQPDATSSVTLYRWASFNLTGRGGTVPVYGARVSAFYAYPSTQANNATANTANDLASSVPSIWNYVQYRDTVQGLPAYGVSGRAGVASLLLASTTLSGASIPDGVFLGTYHIGVLLPIPTNNSRWFNWSVSPYPLGVALGTVGYGGPDHGPNQAFPQYYAAAAIETAPVITTSGTPSPSGVRIGQNLTFTTTLTSTGPAPITSLDAFLFWNNTTVVADYASTTVPLTTEGSTFAFSLTWQVIDNVTGLQDKPFNETFIIGVLWNPGNVTGISGFVNYSQPVLVRPSDVAILGTSGLPNPIDTSQPYVAAYSLAYNGSSPATVYLFATSSDGSSRVEVGAASSYAGNFTLSWSASSLSPGTSYTFQLEASFNGVLAYYNYSGVYPVPSNTSPTSFLFQTILGLPLWIWLVIVAAAVVAIVVALLFLRRTAAGKLVECGECGNLIPEDATVCPKCGAEFETDLVRCSRCASTIPAKSSICPECAALLLGTSQEAGESAERQGYQDFTEKYRAEAKRELGENFNEGSFWDWWKRQPTYVPYNQWKLQQGQGTPRTGMTEPPAAAAPTQSAASPPKQPPKGGAGAAAGAGAAPAAGSRPSGAPSPPKTAAAAPAPAGATAGTPPPAGSPPAGFKNCPGCGKEIPGDYLICPFCSSVVQ